MIKLGLNGAAAQPEIINKLKSAKADVIQVSSGLLVRSDSDVNEILKGTDPQIQAEPVDAKTLKSDSTTPKDVLAFLAE